MAVNGRHAMIDKRSECVDNSITMKSNRSEASSMNRVKKCGESESLELAISTDFRGCDNESRPVQ
jgi:hypothetical protein